MIYNVPGEVGWDRTQELFSNLPGGVFKSAPLLFTHTTWVIKKHFYSEIWPEILGAVCLQTDSWVCNVPHHGGGGGGDEGGTIKGPHTAQTQTNGQLPSSNHSVVSRLTRWAEKLHLKHNN